MDRNEDGERAAEDLRRDSGREVGEGEGAPAPASADSADAASGRGEGDANAPSASRWSGGGGGDRGRYGDGGGEAGDGGGGGGGGGGDANDYGGGQPDLEADVDILKRVWCNEKVAPEILPYESQLVDRLQEQVLLMEENIAASSAEIANELMLSLYRMDMSRTNFLLRSYLRTRLSKIEMFAEHLLSSEDLSGRLSAYELEFASRYREVLSKHLKQTVLDNLPDNYQSMSRQTSQSEEDDMVPMPQLDTFVVCRTKENIGSFQLDDRGDETVDLLQEDLHILRYRPIRRLLEADRVELI